MPEKQSRIATQGGKTGSGRNSFTRNVLYFYITEEPVVLIQDWQKNYGYDLNKSRPQLIKIIYQMVDNSGNVIREPEVVGGYVSPPNKPFYGKFGFPALRVGVNIISVKNALLARINLAKQLLKEPIGDSEHESKKHLRKCSKVLRFRLKRLKKMIEDGRTRMVLITAWREKNKREKRIVDHLVLNQAFFDTFYPQKAFPIGSKENRAKDNSWIGSDYFVHTLFPIDYSKPDMKQMRDKGIRVPAHKWIFKPIQKSHNGWNISLDIKFKRYLSIPKKTDETSTVKPTIIPTIKPPNEVINEFEQHQEQAQSTEDGINVQEEGMQILEDLDGRDDDVIMEQHRKDAIRILKKTFKQQYDQVTWDLDTIEATDERVDELVDEATRLAYDWRIASNGLPIDPESDKWFQNLFEKSGVLLGKRGKITLGEIKGMKPKERNFNKKDFDRKVDEYLEEMKDAREHGWSGELETEVIGDKYLELIDIKLNDFDKITTKDPRFKKILDEALDNAAEAQIHASSSAFRIAQTKINKKLVEEMRGMVTDKSWDGDKFLYYYLENENYKAGGHKLASEELRQLRARNEKELLSFNENENIDINQELKVLIRIHVEIFGLKVPDKFKNNQKIQEFEKELNARRKGKLSANIDFESTDIPSDEYRIV